MRCPYCRADDTSVIDSRLSEGGEAIRRRRECESCKQRFSTYERAAVREPMLIKRDGSKEPFEREKLLRGMTRACEKRPVSHERIEDAAADIEAALRADTRDAIPSKEVGAMVMERLRGLDEVAYVRFASVYKQFKDPHQFVAELKNLPAKHKTAKKRST